jgi:hypothetical protein
VLERGRAHDVPVDVAGAGDVEELLGADAGTGLRAQKITSPPATMRRSPKTFIHGPTRIGGGIGGGAGGGVAGADGTADAWRAAAVVAAAAAAKVLIAAVDPLRWAFWP